MAYSSSEPSSEASRLTHKAESAAENFMKSQHSQSENGIEKGVLGQTAGDFPSDTFLWLTLASIGISASMKILGRSKDANFVGEWAPTFLALGTYSKLMKLEKAIAQLRE